MQTYVCVTVSESTCNVCVCVCVPYLDDVPGHMLQVALTPRTDSNKKDIAY